MFSMVSEIIQPGKSAQLLFLLLIGILGYTAYYLGTKGRTWEIRSLEGLEAMFEGVGRSAEMGRPILVLPGISDMGSPQTLAGITILGELTQQGAEIGVTTYSSNADSGVLTASEAVVRSAYAAVGKPELYSPGKYVRWFGNDQFAYAVGAAGQILADNPAVVVYLGYFLFDVIVDGETGNSIGAVQVGGTLGSMDFMSVFCDYILIGEELFAASAAISKDKNTIATIAGQDWVKLIVLGILIVGTLVSLAGSDAIVRLLEM
jgi:hypothetical protein